MLSTKVRHLHQNCWLEAEKTSGKKKTCFFLQQTLQGGRLGVGRVEGGLEKVQFCKQLRIIRRKRIARSNKKCHVGRIYFPAQMLCNLPYALQTRETLTGNKLLFGYSIVCTLCTQTEPSVWVFLYDTSDRIEMRTP